MRDVFLSCALITAILGSLVPAGVGAQVMTTDVKNTAQTTVVAGKTASSLIVQGKQLVKDTILVANSYADKWKEWVGDPMVNYIAKTTLRAISQSVVNWINNDFEGSPSFLTNPEGFLGGIANKVIGKTISEIDPLWCEPFRFNLKLAFGLSYGFRGAEEEIGCTLTDVIANVQGAYDSFVSGTSNFQNGGWQNWISITGNQQNNAYGAYLTTVNKLDASIVTASGKEIKLLDWGGGFKSWRKCARYTEEGPALPDGSFSPRPDGVAGPLTASGDFTPRECAEYGPVETPGSFISSQLSKATGTDLDALGVADEINEIVAALANLMIRKVMTAGLGGASDYASASYASGTYETLGECKDATDPASVLNPNSPNYDYRLLEFVAGPDGEPIRNRYYNPGLAEARLTRCRVKDHEFTLAFNTQNLLSNVKDRQNLINESNVVAPSSDTVIADANSQGSKDAADAAKTVVPPDGGDGGVVGGVSDPDVSSSGLGGKPKTTRQSTVAPHSPRGKHRNDGMEYYGPDRATDGDTDGNCSASNGKCVETLWEQYPWWEIDLGQEYTIKEVHIERRDDSNLKPGKYLSDTYIFITDAPYPGIERDPSTKAVKPLAISAGVKIPIPDEGQTELRPLPVPINKKGRYVRIQRNMSGELSFAEVKILQSTEASERKSAPTFSNFAIDYTTSNTGQPRSTAQSSPETNVKYSSRFGNDGNRAGSNIADSSSLVLVANNKYPWWYVDLGSEKQIGEIKLWRRTDGPHLNSYAADTNSGEFLSSVYAFVTRADEPECEQSPLERPACWERGVEVPIPKQPEVRPITIPMNERGRFVRIQRNSLNYDLSFAEVEVYEQKGTVIPRPQPPVLTVTPEAIRYRPGGANPNSASIRMGDNTPPSFVIRNTGSSSRKIQIIARLANNASLVDLISAFRISTQDADSPTGAAFPGIPGRNCTDSPSNLDCVLTRTTPDSQGLTYIHVDFTLPAGKGIRIIYDITAQHYYNTNHYKYPLVDPQNGHSIVTDIHEGDMKGPILDSQVIKFD